MSTSLSIYPFKSIAVQQAHINIEQYFAKLSGLQGADVCFVTDDRLNIPNLRRLPDDHCIDNYPDFRYNICERNYVKSGAIFIIMNPENIVQNVEKYPSCLASVSNIGLRAGAQLLLEIGAALGLAKAMGNDCIFQIGDFSWLVGEHKTSPHTNYDEDMERDGFVDEYDIPLELVDALPDAEPADTIEQAVSNFFKTYKFPY